jgi:hypothetical protein
MSVAFFSCKSQTKELDNYKTIYFSDSVVVYNNEDDTVKHYSTDKYLLVTKDSTLYVLNNTKKKAYEIHFVGCYGYSYRSWPDADVVVYRMAATYNNKDTALFTIAFYDGDIHNRVHSFGMKIDGGKIIIVKIKRPKRKDGTNNI